MKNIGIIGVGGVANGKHITELLTCREARIVAICDTDKAALKRTAERLSLDKAHCFEDYKALIDSPEVDAVEICTPNCFHVEMAAYAVRRSKPVNVEKPLGISLEECLPLEALLNETGVLNMMCFSYRFMPAVRYAKERIDTGALGDIVGVNVAYLKSSAFWEGRRLEWRFVKKYAGTGVLGDLGVHLIDMATLLVGDVRSVNAMTGIVVKERMRLDSDEIAPVETDDHCNFIATLEDRRTGKETPAVFSITRCAIGHANTIRYDIFGTKGSISFDLNDPSVLSFSIGEDAKSAKLHTEKVPERFFVKQEEAFVDALHGRLCDHFPTVLDGVRCQRVLDAILRSAEEKRIIEL